MKEFLCAIAVLCLSACTLQVENMAKNNPTRGDTYSYMVGAIGGQIAAKSSMGTSLASDQQKSFADFMQAVGVAYASWSTASVQKAQEVTTQYQAGQITKRQAQQSLERISLAEIASKEAIAKIPH